ncbi:sulfatase family protein [Lentisphaera araneosa HTCC2155]|uniref:Sulfatase family protein n=1 Tax=Lentisphaera araneosa HTCC2155 TaxID=313628 RepID=A6DJM0_9BACT|nr:sulfatase-like hydrolase/transferase [Lentisphaera araneosa]EDM28094.1 sulfatase family protein [Lentisphaera araneosa HTCC2155]
MNVKINKIVRALIAFLAVNSINAQTKKNILFIAVDDLKPILACYGDSTVLTPNIDRLAAQGTVFMNNHSQFAVCGPSRASLMTGLMPEETGVTSFIKMRSNKNAQLKDLITLPQHFKNNGYETAATGKLNDNRCVGSVNADGTVNDDGNDVDDPASWSIPYVKAGPGHQGPTAIKQGTSNTVMKKATESIDDVDSAFPDGKVLEEALVLLNDLATNDKSFFLGVGFKKPHLPFVAPKKYWDLYNRDDFSPANHQGAILNDSGYVMNSVEELRNKYYFQTDASGLAIPLTSETFSHEEQKELIHGYYACVSHVDALIGVLLDELENLKLSDNTIIVLWGDHGFHLGDHNRWGKHTVLEQSTRSPLIISAPAYPGGQTTQSPTTFLDLYPTLCAMNGLAQPQQPLNSTQVTGRPLRGKSLIPILNDPTALVQIGAVSTIYPKNGAIGYAYRTEDYRYIEWIKDGEVVAQDLYDYLHDPDETQNIAQDNSYELAQTMHILSEIMRSESECNGCEVLKASNPIPAPQQNDAPVWTKSTINRTADANTDFTVFLNWAASDPNQDALLYSIVSGPSWLTMANSSLGKLNGTPSIEHIGDNTFVIAVSDSYNAPVNVSLIITVDGINLPPQWTKQSYTKIATQNTQFSSFMNWAASDSDSNTLSYSIVSGPSWLSLVNNSNCKLTGTPSSDNLGDNKFVIAVSDGFNPAQEMNLNIKVND